MKIDRTLGEMDGGNKRKRRESGEEGVREGRARGMKGENEVKVMKT